MAILKNTTRTYILIITLLYSKEDFVIRYHENGNCYVQFSTLDLARRLNCGAVRVEEQLEKACILGVFEPVQVNDHVRLYRVQTPPTHIPTVERMMAWAEKKGSYSWKRGASPLALVPRGSDSPSESPGTEGEE